MKISEIKNIKIDDKGQLLIPQHIKRLKIDIGLSWCAPNSAAWLMQDVARQLFIIGVEANRFACKRIGNKVLNPHPPHEEFIINSDNYMLLNCAMDNVEETDELQMRTFYHVGGDPGTSSLLKPTSKLKNRYNLDVEEVSDVPTIPLSSILKRIPWNRFDYIEHIKTDCQGKDLEIVESAGDFLKKVVFLDCEVATGGLYENEKNVLDVVEKIKSMGFKLLSYGVNSSFVNIELEHLVKPNNLNNYTTKY